MNQLIPLVCLVVVLVGYRLATAQCRWLYGSWRWSDTFRVIGEQMVEGIASGIKGDVTVTLEAVETEKLRKCAKAHSSARAIYANGTAITLVSNQPVIIVGGGVRER